MAEKMIHIETEDVGLCSIRCELFGRCNWHWNVDVVLWSADEAFFDMVMWCPGELCPAYDPNNTYEQWIKGQRAIQRPLTTGEDGGKV